MLGVLALPARVAAQRQMEGQPRYALVDLGTLGGPASYVSNGFDGILNNHGAAVGWADTSAPEPFPPFCFNSDCMVSHGFQWHKGVLTDLGALPGGSSSRALWISSNGLISGVAETAQIDPLLAGFAELRAVLWQNGKITNLGTLPGGYESLLGAHNNRGQVVGFSTNGVPDPFSLWYAGFGLSSGTQTRAFLWQNGVMKDLGTLGGPDASASFVNEPDQVAGVAYTTSTPNSENGRSCLPNVPTQDPFLWEQGKMTDLPGALPQNHDAFLWRNGAMTDLGTLPGDSCSKAYSVNASGQVVGTSESRALCLIPTGEHAFLSQPGRPMIDLNTAIPGGEHLRKAAVAGVSVGSPVADLLVPPSAGA